VKVNWWTTRRVQTDIYSREWGYLYTDAKVRPAWYWFYRRLCLFAGIVWRRIDSQIPDRLDWLTAWEVSAVAKGLTSQPHPGGERTEGGQT
jgi:hypothetical protein